jgi:hypothetical protein
VFAEVAKQKMTDLPHDPLGTIIVNRTLRDQAGGRFDALLKFYVRGSAWELGDGNNVNRESCDVPILG